MEGDSPLVGDNQDIPESRSQTRSGVDKPHAQPQVEAVRGCRLGLPKARGSLKSRGRGNTCRSADLEGRRADRFLKPAAQEVRGTMQEELTQDGSEPSSNPL